MADVWCPSLSEATKSFEFLPQGFVPQTREGNKSARIAGDNIIWLPWELTLCCMGMFREGMVTSGQ